MAVKVKINEGVMRLAKRELRRAGKRVSQHRVTIGIHNDEPKVDYDGKDSDATLAMVAMWHEFGTGTVPPRSFLRQWYDSNTGRIRSEMSKAMAAEYNGKKSAVHQLARRWAREVASIIRRGESFAPLETATVDKKAAHGLPSPKKPLIATGQLVSSISAQVDGDDV